MTATSHIHIPPEWDLQSAVWVGWPTLQDEWGEAFHLARGEIAAFVRALSRFVPVCVAAGSEEAATSAETQCGAVARVHHIPLGDIWLRDTGPIIADIDGAASALTFRFDGWGGKFIMPGDTETAGTIAQKLDLPERRFPFILEGGAIEMDGAGTLITTRQCLLDGIRNPGLEAAAAEHLLEEALGVSNIIWLERGLINDHTDGHVDNLARFVGPGHVVCQRASGADDPNAEIFTNIEAALLAEGLTVSTLPSPGRITQGGDILPASHLNFLITNDAVLMPVFEDRYAQEAAAGLSELFPERQIISLPAIAILSGGGTFHCMTKDIPDTFDWNRLS